MPSSCRRGLSVLQLLTTPTEPPALELYVCGPPGDVPLALFARAVVCQPESLTCRTRRGEQTPAIRGMILQRWMVQNKWKAL